MDTDTSAVDITIDKKRIFKRLMAIRSRLIFYYPFFGSLLMRLKLSLADCKTAATDMERVIFDPEFLSGLSDEEIEFVMLHEVMHCALEHCIRGKGKIKKIYNLACDIVVNSSIIREMCEVSGICDYKILVAGEEPVHVTPNGNEGYYYTAEQVYEMLLDRINDSDNDDNATIGELEGSMVDDHDIWDSISGNTLVADEWKQTLIKAVKEYDGEYGIPMSIRNLVSDYKHRSNLNWKEILHNFIQIVTDSYDYFFTLPDKRYLYGDIILPSFTEIEREKVENIWFLIDTSGSISAKTMTALFGEICTAIEQIGNLSGKLSFFDDSVTEPLDFSDLDDFVSIVPTGGGGTSFGKIFDYMRNNMQNELPRAIVILTDGYCEYPNENAAIGIPVMWVIIDNSDEAPWGTTIHIKESE